MAMNRLEPAATAGKAVKSRSAATVLRTAFTAERRRLGWQRDEAGGVRPLWRHPGYLISASELQIKIAQGSKPGEGGQLPASKVVEHIRGSGTPSQG